MHDPQALMQALKALRREEQTPDPTDEERVSEADLIADAVTAALSRFTDDQGNLKVRAPYLPYGGG